MVSNALPSITRDGRRERRQAGGHARLSGFDVAHWFCTDGRHLGCSADQHSSRSGGQRQSRLVSGVRSCLRLLASESVTRVSGVSERRGATFTFLKKVEWSFALDSQLTQRLKGCVEHL